MTDSRRRVVAIVGRPNVGKSAIFNRLAKERIAIVHHEAGVTRDRLMRELVWDDQRFALIDTGGISGFDGEKIHDVITAGIVTQAEMAMEDAAVCVLVVDITAGLLPMDIEVGRLLRKRGMQVIVAANKADLPRHEDGMDEFARLGFPVYPVSALHDRGFGDLMEHVLSLLPKVSPEEGEAEGGSAERPLTVAVVGRPNAGKSSFINKLLQSERLLVSEIPGTTRDSIDVPFSVGQGAARRHYVLIDTAGARRTSKVDTAVERYSRYRMQDSVERADVVVLMLDVERGVGLLDKQLASQIQKNAKGSLLIVNKWDLATETPKAYRMALEYEIPFMAYCPAVFISTKNGTHIQEAIETIDRVAGAMQLKLPTGVLNRVLAEASERVPPPSHGKHPGRMYYATQVGVNPVTVRIFVNDPGKFPMNYRDYLINQFRAHFGLEGAPVRIQFRERQRGQAKT